MPRSSPADKTDKLVALDLSYPHELTQPLPQLPALLSLHVRTEDLQTVSSVAALQELEVSGGIASGRPTPWLTSHACTPCLWYYLAQSSTSTLNCCPPSLGSINIMGDVLCPPIADQLASPAGGNIDNIYLGHGEYVISWTRQSENGLAIQSRRELKGMLAIWTFRCLS